MPVKISQLPTASSVTSDDFFPIVDSGSLTTQKASAQQILNFVTGSTFNILNVSGNANVSGNLFVDGRITAQEFYTENISASILFESGSTKFGNDSTDTHEFSGSVLVSGVINVNDLITATNGQFAILSSSIGLFTNITSSIISGSTGLFNVQTSSNALFTGDIRVLGTASIGQLNTITQQSLLIGDKYITILSGGVDHTGINGAGFLWGTSSGPGETTGSLGEHAHILYDASRDALKIFPGLYVTGSTTLFGVSGTIAQFTTISASSANISGNLVIDGPVNLAQFPDYAYVLYTASFDKIVVYPGLYVSGNLTGSGLGAFQTISGSTGLFTTLTGSTITGSTALFTTVTGSIVTGSTALFTTVTASNILVNGNSLTTNVSNFNLLNSPASITAFQSASNISFGSTFNTGTTFALTGANSGSIIIVSNDSNITNDEELGIFSVFAPISASAATIGPRGSMRVVRDGIGGAGKIKFDAGFAGSTSRRGDLLTITTQGILIRDGLVIGNNPTTVALDSGNLFVSGSTKFGSSSTTNHQFSGSVNISGTLTATAKSFDIVHPTKDGMRLRYGSLEGPENGVYVRGVATSNIIELPEHWTGLVHEDSITVNLTPFGSRQNIWVDKVENNKVYINGDLVKCYFTVFAERKDISKLVVEY